MRTRYPRRCKEVIKPIPLLLVFLIPFLLSVHAAAIPVIYSTDLMHPHVDPDDHFDLACLYAMPEADIRAIVLDQGERQAQFPGYKAVWQMNYLTKRHVPAAIGLRDKLKSPEDQGLNQPAEFQNGVNLILQALRDSREKVVMIFVGSGRDFAAAYNREPSLFHKKVRAIHGYIGDASDPKHIEWNVNLDPQAYVRLMRANLPFYWIPCFDGGAWQNKGHASFWKVKNGGLIGNAPEAVQNYFLYMFRHSTNDPIASLYQPMQKQDRDWMMNGDRNMWCGAFLGMAFGKPVLHEGKPVAVFSPVEVSIGSNAVVRIGKSNTSRRVMLFEIKDQAHFAEAATRATAKCLESLPLRSQKENPAPGK